MGAKHIGRVAHLQPQVKAEAPTSGPRPPEHERPLLTDQQLRDTSIDQMEDLVHRLNLVLQKRGMSGIVIGTGTIVISLLAP
jgi:hypothetical protein